jgi:hypothetical protein
MGKTITGDPEVHLGTEASHNDRILCLLRPSPNGGERCDQEDAPNALTQPDT